MCIHIIYIYKCVYIYIYMCICVCICMYTYIYIYIERERDMQHPRRKLINNRSQSRMTNTCMRSLIACIFV